jgi:hypothetical protein
VRSPTGRGRWLAAVVLAAACGGDAPLPTSAPPVTTARVVVRVMTLGDRPLPPSFVRTRTSTTVDSAAIGADGRAQLTVSARDSVELTVSVTASSHYGSAWSERFARDTTIDVVLIPRTWTIQRGVHTGTTRVIDLAKAVSASVPNTHYLNAFSPGARAVAAWPLSALPIAVGVDTTGGTQLWKARDSAFFWSSVAELNAQIGREVFKPAGAVAPKSIEKIAVHLDPRVTVAGGALSNQCDAGQHLCTRRFGELWIRPDFSYPSGPFAEQNRRMVKHELLHALGFGHSCYWPSLMLVTVLDCVSLSELPMALTADDAAYIELMFELATALESRPAAWSIDEAIRATLGARAGTTLGPPSSSYAIQ